VVPENTTEVLFWIVKASRLQNLEQKGYFRLAQIKRNSDTQRTASEGGDAQRSFKTAVFTTAWLTTQAKPQNKIVR
jgi:hypothetical protein